MWSAALWLVWGLEVGFGSREMDSQKVFQSLTAKVPGHPVFRFVLVSESLRRAFPCVWGHKTGEEQVSSRRFAPARAPVG